MIVEQYTTASLSFSKDRLTAISALAREMGKILDFGTEFDCTYLVGL
jgi:hypothetical protein